MKVQIHKSTPILVIVIAAFWVFGCGGQTAKKETAAAGAPATHSTPETTPPSNPGQPAAAGGHEEAETPQPLPSTLAGIWKELETEHSELDQTIASGKLAQVHHIAFRIRDLVGAMPPLSGTLGEQSKTRLADASSRVAQIAASLDEAGDSGDAVAAKAQSTRLGAVLDLVRGLYPAGTLGGN